MMMRMQKTPLPRRLMQRFANDRGNVALVVALSMVPVSLATLGAVDIARSTSAKVQLQDALDAAALGAARSNAQTNSELQTAGDRFLTQNLATDSDFTLTSTNFKFGADGTVIASADLQVTPFVTGLVSGGALKVSAASEVVRSDMKLEIALVLDNTGSMLQGGHTSKLDNLKVAAVNFVTKMEAAAAKGTDPNAIKIALVPFSNAVRVDETAYRNAAWIDQTGASPINDEIFTTATGTQHGNRFTFFSQLGTTWRGCVETRQAPYDVQDTAPTAGATLYTPYFAPDEPDKQTSGYSDTYTNNYVPDGTSNNANWKVRQGSITKYTGTKNGSMSTTFGPNDGCGLKRLQRLTIDYASLKSQINALNADGNTNIPAGLAWGWNVLSPYGPFGDGATYGTAKLKKVVVLMTDGENTMSYVDTPNDSRYSGAGYIWQKRIMQANGQPLDAQADSATRTAALDYRLSLLCSNMKAKNIEIYTIRVEVTTGSSTLLQTCASAADHFYDVADATQLDSVFQTIANQIAALHLSK
jgi:Flp pilus assembly protein TadG